MATPLRYPIGTTVAGPLEDRQKESLAMRAWEQFVGLTIDGVGDLTAVFRTADRSAIFSSVHSDDSGERPAFIHLWRTGEDSAQILNRYREAIFLSDPHLLKVFKAGQIDLNGESLIYAQTEAAESSLAELPRTATLNRGEILTLVSDIVSGLQYLHSETLICCAVGPRSVWKSGPGWKLGDFSQLRVIAESDARGTREYLASSQAAPPEAYEGVAMPAWDVWSLGMLLRELAGQSFGGVAPQENGRREAARQLRSVRFPAPFDQIIRGCLDPNWRARLPLDAVARLASDAIANPVVDDVPPATPAAVAPPSTQPLTQPINPRDPIRNGPPSPRGAQTNSGLHVTPQPRYLPQLPSNPPEVPRHSFLARLGLTGLQAFVMGAAIVLIVCVAYGLMRNPRTVAGLWATPAASRSTDARQLQSSPVKADTGEANRVRENAPQVPDPNAAAGSIDALLNGWVDSTRKQDVTAQVACYASFVKTLNQKRNVSSRELTREKTLDFAVFRPVRKFDITNVSIKNSGSNRATVTFDKNWDFGSINRFAGAARAELTVQRSRGQWKIVSERELQIYWLQHAEPNEAAKTTAGTQLTTDTAARSAETP